MGLAESGLTSVFTWKFSQSKCKVFRCQLCLLYLRITYLLYLIFTQYLSPQQLYKNGSLSCELPPWSGDVFHALGRDEDDDDDQVRQEESLQDNDSMYSNVQDEQNIASNSAYENLEIQSEQSTQPEHAGKNSTAEKNDGKNNYYEPVALKPQPSRPAPSRPLPYDVTRKLSGKSGSEVDHRSLEKVQYCHV